MGNWFAFCSSKTSRYSWNSFGIIFLQGEVLLLWVFCYCQFGCHVSLIDPYFFGIFLYWFQDIFHVNVQSIDCPVHPFFFIYFFQNLRDLRNWFRFRSFCMSNFSLFILLLENKELFQIGLSLPFEFASFPIDFQIVFLKPWELKNNLLFSESGDIEFFFEFFSI